MACRLFGAKPLPKPYQFWVIVNWTIRNKLQWDFNQNSKLFILKNASENIVCDIAAMLSMGRWVNCVLANADRCQWCKNAIPIHIFKQLYLSLLLIKLLFSLSRVRVHTRLAAKCSQYVSYRDVGKLLYLVYSLMRNHIGVYNLGEISSLFRDDIDPCRWICLHG